MLLVKNGFIVKKDSVFDDFSEIHYQLGHKYLKYDLCYASPDFEVIGLGLVYFYDEYSFRLNKFNTKIINKSLVDLTKKINFGGFHQSSFTSTASRLLFKII